MKSSALQRAEIAEMVSMRDWRVTVVPCFSALQRAEIAESRGVANGRGCVHRFSALQRAEIAEILCTSAKRAVSGMFQCSSTSRNC